MLDMTKSCVSRYIHSPDDKRMIIYEYGKTVMYGLNDISLSTNCPVTNEMDGHYTNKQTIL